MTKNWIVTAVNALTGEREQISQQMNRDGPGRAYHDPRPEQIKPTKPLPVQLQLEFEPWQ